MGTQVAKKRRRKKGPPRTEQHVIDTKAQRIYANALPAEWLNRAQNPDYHIDYQAELVSEGNLSGILIGVQLRGKKRLKIANGHVTYSLPTDQLAYYVDKRRDPVFLVLADVTTGDAFYLFTQRYALEQLAGKDWRRQRTIAVRVPVANRLSDVQKLDGDAREADRYMAGLHPSSIEASIQAERQKYEGMDPRFRVGITATEKDRHYELSAKQDVTFSLKFTGEPELTKKLINDVYRGLPITVQPGQVDVEGSDLLASPFKLNMPIQIHATTQIDLNSRIGAINSEGREVGTFELPAVARGGPLEMRVAVEIPNAPFAMYLTLAREPDQLRPIDWSISFPLKKWVAQPLRTLPYFDQLNVIAATIASGGSLRVDLFWQGNRLLGGVARTQHVEAVAEFAKIMATLEKGREFAQHYSLDPRIPSDLHVDDLNQIEDAYWKGMPGVRTIEGNPGRGSTLRGIVLADGLEQFLSDYDRSPVVISIPDEAMMFLRQPVATGPVQYTLSHPELITPAPELRQKAAAGAERIPFVLRATARSEVTVQRPPRTAAASD